MVTTTEAKIVDLPAGEIKNYTTASRDVLYTPVYASVLRSVVSARNRKRLREAPKERRLQIAREAIPGLGIISRQVIEYAKNDAFAERIKLRTPGGVTLTTHAIAHGSCEPHYDNERGFVLDDPEQGRTRFVGPLTLSARIDDLACKRIFTVHRPPVRTLKLVDERLHIEREVYGWSVAGVTETIEQEPGDLVIIGNEPWATRHAVHEDWAGEAPAAQTQALILHYELTAA